MSRGRAKEIARLRRDCAEAYQVLATISPIIEPSATPDIKRDIVRALNNLSAAADGRARPHDDLLPFPRPAADDLPAAPEILELAGAIARGLARAHHEAEEDRAATEAFAARAGEERVPLAVVDRLLAGESPIRVWREHRRMTLEQLATATGVGTDYLLHIENGKGGGAPESLLQAIARALSIDMEELAPNAGM